MAEDLPLTEEEQKPKGKLPLKMIIVMGCVLLIEAGAVSLFWIMRGGPEPAEATAPIEDTQEYSREGLVEIQLAETFQVDNYMKGSSARTMVTLEVFATYLEGDGETSNVEKVTGLVEKHRSEIRDRIRTIVASAKPNDLTDPNLEVIKRIIKSEVEKVIGEGYVQEILLPQWSPITVE